MRLGDIANPDAAAHGKPLDGIRVLALEQMQALPYATQLLARLGADVVKVEHPVNGESGRGAEPAMLDPSGRRVGATFLRNNLNKRSVGIDVTVPAGRELFLRLVPRFDVVAENSKPGTMEKLGLDYAVVAEAHPAAVYVSVSGFGNLVPSPYASWPAYASGIYEYKRPPDGPPVTLPVGALGDISSALFAAVGILAALRHRDRTGESQYVDVAMLDAVMAMTDIVTNFWSLGLRPGPDGKVKEPDVIVHGFRASDGWFVLQVAREHQFGRLATVVGCPDWADDPRFATRAGWIEHLESDIRPGIEKWAASLTKAEAARRLSEAGVPAGPCNTAADLVDDPHVVARHMLVEMPRTDGVDDPVLVPGNPVKLSKVAEGPETRVPWVGEHTEEVLRAELALSDGDLAALRAAGAIA